VGLLRTIRTVIQLAVRVDQLNDDVEELMQEWIDKKDAFERLLKRLSTRDARWRDDAPADPTPSAAAGAPVGAALDKAALRHLARERGMIR